MNFDLSFDFSGKSKQVGLLFRNHSTTKRGLMDARLFGAPLTLCTTSEKLENACWHNCNAMRTGFALKENRVLWVQSKRSKANSPIGSPQACGSYGSPWENKTSALCLFFMSFRGSGDTKASAKKIIIIPRLTAKRPELLKLLQSAPRIKNKRAISFWWMASNSSGHILSLSVV